jgi:ribosome modulation factor
MAYPPRKRLVKAFERGAKSAIRAVSANPYQNKYLRKAWDAGRARGIAEGPSGPASPKPKKI